MSPCFQSLMPAQSALNGFKSSISLPKTGLRQEVRTFCKTCKKYQFSKKVRRKYGHLQTKEAESDP
jgi:hypothetical protein